MVSEAYLEKPLPLRIRTSRIYDDFVNGLIDRKKLDYSDIDIFIKRMFLPLLFESGAYLNKLDAAKLSTSIDPVSKQSLSQIITNDGIVPSTRQAVNQPFINLTDAGILVKYGSPSFYEISFKYERFYDYFGGNYLWELSQKEFPASRPQWYRKMIATIRDWPFLWGPVNQALLKEIVENGEEIVFQMIAKGDNATHDLIENVLTLYVEDDQKVGFGLLAKLYKKRGADYKRMALRVAGLSGYRELLELGGANKGKTVRLTAVQSSYYHWQQNPQSGWKILDGWAQRIRGRFLWPNLAVAEAAIGLSILTLTDRRNSSGQGVQDYKNPIIYANLQPIWRKIISDLLLVSESEIYAIHSSNSFKRVSSYFPSAFLVLDD